MLFKRRQTESLLERVRVHLWPRRSWNRSGRYIVYRLRRLSATLRAHFVRAYLRVFQQRAKRKNHKDVRHARGGPARVSAGAGAAVAFSAWRARVFAASFPPAPQR